MADFGLLPEDLAPDTEEVEVLQENWDAVMLFMRFRTQWRTGVHGPTGLDYNVILHELDRRGLDQGIYDDMLERIGIIEDAALAELHRADGA